MFQIIWPFVFPGTLTRINSKLLKNISHLGEVWIPTSRASGMKKACRGENLCKCIYEEEQLLMASKPRRSSGLPTPRLIDMILDNSVAGLINLNLVERQAVRAAGCFPQNYNDHGAITSTESPKTVKLWKRWKISFGPGGVGQKRKICRLDPSSRTQWFQKIAKGEFGK